MENTNVKVKICGLTCEEDLRTAMSAGADFAGMVLFFPKSRRNIEIDKAKRLINQVSWTGPQLGWDSAGWIDSEDLIDPEAFGEEAPGTIGDGSDWSAESTKTSGFSGTSGDESQNNDIKWVAVTVSPTPEQVLAIENAGFDYVQIHGAFDPDILKLPCFDDSAADEDSDGWVDLDTEVDKQLKIIRAFNKMGEKQFEEIKALNRVDAVEYYLLDAAEPGSGKAFDWNGIPDSSILCKPFFLAGGLKPETVEDTIKVIEQLTGEKPFAVDVSTGVEKDELPSPEEIAEGVSMKDPKKVKDFIDNAKRV